MDISGLESILYSTHALLATLSKTPELMLTQGEAESLAHASARVAEHYDIGATMAPELLAWVALVQTAAVIYGPRIFAVRARRKTDAAPAPQGFYQP